MILTCPACGTQYVVKDGAIPEGGRKVRCASCRHSWHQDAPAEEPLELEEPIEPGEPIGSEADGYDQADADAGYVVDTPDGEHHADTYPADAEHGAVGSSLPENEPPATSSPWEEHERGEDERISYNSYATPAADIGTQADVDDDFSPFADRGETEGRRRSPVVAIVLVVVLVAALAAAFWFLAPAEWKARVGLTAAGQTPLQLMMTHSDRQALASGNELLAVSGRVINPTRDPQRVPPIQAELRGSDGKLVYRWTIAPPTQTLAPGASARFNSAEVNVPAGGEELTVSLGPSGA